MVIIYHEARIGDSLFAYKKAKKKEVSLKLRNSYDFLDKVNSVKSTIPNNKYEIRNLLCYMMIDK